MFIQTQQTPNPNSLNFFKSKFFFDRPENKSFFILPQLPSLQEHNDTEDFEHLF